MKLIRCEIQNFGKIRKGTYEFKDGCNAFCERNGWGKSTLAAFIKIMLYGFENERTRSEFENERRRFRPWQGGVYGGKLVFESNGETYEIERIFGSREKDDKFCVRNLRTNLEDTSFLPNVGEALFKIDRESFDRTVFISQSDCATSSTDSINAKLGNLVENTNDINNYDSANQAMIDVINKLSPDKKNGSLNVLSNSIAELRNTLIHKKEIDEAISDNVKTMKEKEEYFENLKDRQKELQESQETTSHLMEIKTKQEKYQGLVHEAQIRREALDKEQKNFPGAIPEETEIDEIIEVGSKLTGLNQSVANYTLTPEEQNELESWDSKFKDTPPAPEEVDAVIKETANYFRMSQEYSKTQQPVVDDSKIKEYEARFSGNIPREVELDSRLETWNKRNARANAIPAKEASLDALRNAPSKVSITPTIFIGGLLAFAGFILFLLPMVSKSIAGSAKVTMNAGGILAFIVGVILVIVGIVNVKSNTSHVNPEVDKLLDEIKKDKDYVEAIDGQMQLFLTKYKLPFDTERVTEYIFGLKNMLKEYEELVDKKDEVVHDDAIEKLQESSNKIEAFITKYYGASQGDNYLELIHDLQYGSETYRYLFAKKQALAQFETERNEVLKVIQDFFDRLNIKMESDLYTQLVNMKSHLQAYRICLQEWEHADAEVKKFEAAEDMNVIKNTQLPEKLESLETLHTQLVEIAEQIDETHKFLDEITKVVSDLYLKKEEFDDAEDSLKDLSEKYEADNKKYDLVSKARDFLETARTNIIGKYIGPIKAGFSKYYNILTHESADRYHIDANTHLTVEEEGMQREVHFFSSGYQDMIGICMRMSLVAAMYKDEKPFIIFDDPFINLDMDKTEGALQFLEEVSKEYQVIYFTCNDSRIRK